MGVHNISQVPDRGDEAESKEDQGVCRPLLILATALAPVIGYDKASRIEHYAMDNEVITQSSFGAALTVSWQRFVGTMLGTVVGAIVASQFGPHVLVFGTCVFILGLLRAVAHLYLICISVRRSVHRNWGSADVGGGVAEEGSHTIGEKVNSSSIPSERMAPWLRKK
jgi:hypothetical protein